MLIDFQNTNFPIVAPVIVNDFSWALLNSTFEVFNKCSIGNYLNWCFDSLLKFQLENIPVESHFLIL